MLRPERSVCIRYLANENRVRELIPLVGTRDTVAMVAPIKKAGREKTKYKVASPKVVMSLT